MLGLVSVSRKTFINNTRYKGKNYFKLSKRSMALVYILTAH